MQKLFSFFILAFLLNNCFAQNATTTSILDETVLFALPPSLKMSKENMEQDTATRTWLYTNSKGNIRLLMTFHKHIALDDNGIPGYADQQLKELGTLTGIKPVDDGIFLQDGKNIGYVKYLNVANDPPHYQLNFFISVHGRLLYGQFTCPISVRNKWEAEADKIANSLRVDFAE